MEMVIFNIIARWNVDNDDTSSFRQHNLHMFSVTPDDVIYVWATDIDSVMTGLTGYYSNNKCVINGLICGNIR